MRFRIGLLLSLFGGIIGIGLFRELIKSKCPALDDKTLDIVSLLILLIGLIISAIEHFKQSKDLKKLENEQKGRVLEPKQIENLLEALNTLPKTKVKLTGIQGDRESVRFANTIKEILIEVDWEVDGVWEDIILGGIGPGITVREKSNNPKSIGKNIMEIMNKNHIETRLVIKSDLKPDQIEIIVGSRP